MSFIQEPPRLGNQYDEDRVLKSYLARLFGSDAPALGGELRELASECGELLELQLADRLNEPKLVNWDPWGNRVDRVELTQLWQRARLVAARRGVVATAYEAAHGWRSRPHQFALVYLFEPASDVYTCPLAMTDGAARTIINHRNAALADRALGRLTSRDPDHAWTSGQWMTERTGGSDVGLSETVARLAQGESVAGISPAYRLYGNKFFTSAAQSEMALTLGRIEGAPEGGRGLTLFYLETRDAAGRYNGITLHRLKDKLGTKKVPTAELDLDGALAVPVTELGNGTRSITPMLNITRTWNTVCAVGAMRHAIALGRDYARRRVQFGAPLSEKPLHLDTLAALQAEFEAAFGLAFRITELLGKAEQGVADDDEQALLRVLTPIGKLTTGKQAVVIASEVLECIGGAGYMEDTGLPRLLRDAQVLPIWEGTTNVLSLDLLRALRQDPDLALLGRELLRLTDGCRDDALSRLGSRARATLERAADWLKSTVPEDVEAGARRFALTVGRTMELALLCHHAQWALEQGDDLPKLAAIRFAAHGLDQLGQGPWPREDAARLANDIRIGPR